MIELELHHPLARGQYFHIEREYLPDGISVGEHCGVNAKTDGGDQFCVGEIKDVTAELAKIEIVRVYGGGK